MRLTHISIENYRCFERYQVNFRPGFNVLIGRNGAGKSTVLNAVVTLLSFMFSKDSSLGNQFLSAGINTLNLHALNYDDYYLNYHTGVMAGELTLTAKALMKSTADEIADKATDSYVTGPDEALTQLHWVMTRRNSKGAKVKSTGYREAFRAINARYLNNEPLPIVTYYSDSFPHRYTALTKLGLQAANTGLRQRNPAYYQWDDSDACIGVWETRYCNLATQVVSYTTQHLDRPRPDSGPMVAIFNEYDKITKAMKDFSAVLDPDYTIENISIENGSSRRQHIRFHFSNAAPATFDTLPAGYSRMFSLAFDLICRSYVLNGRSSSSGIAVIDEIDLHLHPALQQRACEALSSSFPDMQFIVTTHSPLLIANLPTANDRNVVLRMRAPESDGVESPQGRLSERGGQVLQPEQLDSVYGMRLDANLEDVMDTPPANSEAMTLARSYCLLKNAGADEAAAAIFEDMSGRIGREQFLRIVEKCD